MWVLKVDACTIVVAVHIQLSNRDVVLSTKLYHYGAVVVDVWATAWVN
jgi:hypothetical protein